jgi:hypothetical protein
VFKPEKGENIMTESSKRRISKLLRHARQNVFNDEATYFPRILRCKDLLADTNRARQDRLRNNYLEKWLALQ